MSRVSVALRLARRDVVRSRGRSALVVAMIALPVLGVGAADVLFRSFQLTPDQSATRRMGAADAVLADSGQVSVHQLPTVEGIAEAGGWLDGEQARRGPAPSYRSVLPAGSRAIVQVDAGEGVRVSAGRATTSAQATSVDLDDPLTRGLYVDRHGRAARGSGEVVVSNGLARRMGLKLGDQAEVTTPQGTSSRRVVGTVEVPGALSERLVLLAPGQLGRGTTTHYLVDVAAPLAWSDVLKANASGYLLQPRGHVLGEPPVPVQVQSAIDAATVTAVSLVVGMALLEVVLLAGPAFAVGAKRRSRELALLAATGAERSDVRRTVLAGGLVIGGLGGLVGVSGGLLLTRLALHRLERVNDALIGSFDVRPLELLLVAAVGAVTAVLASVIPARTAARQDVVAGLTGRRGTMRSLKRVPVLGVLAAGAGALVALEGARRRNVNLILAGSAIAELGLVATTPFLVGLAGRSGRFLPLGPRLALRDAARNRGRTAPAVSAILAAVAGSVAIATVVVSFDRRDHDAYQAQAPYGTSWVLLDNQPSATGATADAVAAAMRADLPGARVSVVHGLGGPFVAGPAPGKGLPVFVDVQLGDCAQTARPAPDGSSFACDVATNGGGALGGILVGDAALVHDLTGADGDALTAVRRVLARGGAVVPEDALLPDGTAVLRVHLSNENGPGQARTVAVPAVAVPGSYGSVVLSAAAAARTGVATRVVGVVASASRPPSGAEEDRLRGALRPLDLDGMLFVERGYHSDYTIGLLALLVGSAVIVLGASGIATGLAAADGRSDLATLAAVGASPRTRRVLAAFQSAVTAGLGTLLGIVAGMVPAIAILRAMTRTVEVVDGHQIKQTVLPIVMPWTNIAVTLLVVPVLAALAAAALTRSRLPMVRRLG
jgi:putative ABC transport system permease protein